MNTLSIHPPLLTRLSITLAIMVCSLWLAPAAHAGRSCEPKRLDALAVEQGMALAQRTSDALDEEQSRSGARVVVLGRAGQDLSKYGLRYSHLGWAYKTPDGPWRVVHKLNDCGTAVGAVYQQGLGEFFMDDLWRQEAVWAVPVPALQAPLLALLTDPTRRTLLHSADYSMVSYAWGLRYQQSNQWALETLAVAVEPAVQGREQAQAWLRFKGYQPTPLEVGPLERLGARVGSANIAFDDHPNSKRFSNRIETVTVDSVLNWLVRSGLAGAPQTLGR